jgi:hypothetical protein
VIDVRSRPSCGASWSGLRGAYGVDRGTVAATLEKILDTAQFVIDGK